MPRHVKDARIETREARRKLAVQSEPHWRAIVQGAHVGYYKGARRGAWLVRWRKPEGGYQKATLGEADDTRDADGVARPGLPAGAAEGARADRRGGSARRTPRRRRRRSPSPTW